MNSLSHSSFILVIWSFNWEFLFLMIEQATTCLLVPQCLPNSSLERTKTYGTFWNKKLKPEKRLEGWLRAWEEGGRNNRGRMKEEGGERRKKGGE